MDPYPDDDDDDDDYGGRYRHDQLKRVFLTKEWLHIRVMATILSSIIRTVMVMSNA